MKPLLKITPAPCDLDLYCDNSINEVIRLLKLLKEGESLKNNHR